MVNSGVTFNLNEATVADGYANFGDRIDSSDTLTPKDSSIFRSYTQRGDDPSTMRQADTFPTAYAKNQRPWS